MGGRRGSDVTVAARRRCARAVSRSVRVRPPARHVATEPDGGEPAGLLGGTALQQQWQRQRQLRVRGQPGAGASLALHPQRGHGEDPAGRPARVGQEQLQGELPLRQPSPLADPPGQPQSPGDREPQQWGEEQLPVRGGFPGEEEGGGAAAEEERGLDLGLVQPAREHPTQGIPLQAPPAHGHAQHEEHQRHEERGDFLCRIPQGFPPIPAALSPAGHWTGDLHREAPDHHSFQQHLLEQLAVELEQSRVSWSTAGAEEGSWSWHRRVCVLSVSCFSLV